MFIRTFVEYFVVFMTVLFASGSNADSWSRIGEYVSLSQFEGYGGQISLKEFKDLYLIEVSMKDFTRCPIEFFSAQSVDSKGKTIMTAHLKEKNEKYSFYVGELYLSNTSVKVMCDTDGLDLVVLELKHMKVN